MNNKFEAPGEPMDKSFENADQLPDLTPRKIDGEDSAEKISPIDANADEKVLVNKEDKKWMFIKAIKRVNENRILFIALD